MASPRVKAPNRRPHKDIHLRIDPELAEELEKLAEAEHRPLGRQIEYILRCYLEARKEGFLT